jgi:hypothetical protein
MEQKVIITENSYEINPLLKEGWRVVSVTAQFVATGAVFETRGKFCFVLERG